MTNPQRSIVNLPSRKALIYCLLIGISTLSTVIGVLWYKLETYETRNDGSSSGRIADLTTENAALKVENKQLHEAKYKAKEDCDAELKAKDQETINDLKERLALQENVNKMAKEAEKKVDVVVRQTESKITRLTHEIQEKQNQN